MLYLLATPNEVTPMNPALAVNIQNVRQLEEALHELVPLSRHLGVKVAEYDGTQLRLAAPLAPNMNHQRSAFGGSLYCLAALTGWGLLHLKLGELGMICNTVIAKAELAYLAPIWGDFQCQASLPEDSDALFARLAETGKARAQLAATIGEPAAPAMQCQALYHLRRA